MILWVDEKMMQRVSVKPMKAWSLHEHSEWQWPEEEVLLES
jgi:hypothetical protein